MPRARKRFGRFCKKRWPKSCRSIWTRLTATLGIRATLGVSPADAMHLAAAAQAGTDLFLTNDNRLVGKFVPGIQFIASLHDNVL